MQTWRAGAGRGVQNRANSRAGGGCRAWELEGAGAGGLEGGLGLERLEGLGASRFGPPKPGAG